jgi:hypothetical protein
LTQARVPLRRLTATLLRAAAWGGEHSVLRLWQGLEPLAMRMWRVRPVRDGALLEFGISPYRGPSTVLSDGTRVPRGARILHLHLDNRRVIEIVQSAGGGPWALAPLLNDDLDALAGTFASGALGSVVALRGITVHAAMARRFGFEVRPLPRSLRWALIRLLGAIVFLSYRPEDTRVLEEGIPWPGEIWMSASALRNRRPRTAGVLAKGAHRHADP